jgi:peptide-methionine (S)-S-oxide reductase
MIGKFARLLAGCIALLVALPAQAQTTATGSTGLSTATFAGGCFWCMEPPFDKLEGVFSAYSGFMGGTTANPTYEQVTRGGTGHTEVVQITYDPAKVSYAKLLDTFWVNIDPLDKNGQFCDRGDTYRPEIFVHNDEQRRFADESKAKLDASKKFQWPIVVPVTAASTFTKAEDYHQKFYKKNPGHYNRYRTGCGRDARLEALWGKDATTAVKTQ